jgi:ABC-type Mn2+/Zn2+ transport system ATPase subunit
MLSVSQITLERHFQPVFEPLDFHLERGAVLLITGANGCGKSTLIRLLAGILTPTSGTLQSNAQGMAYVGHSLAFKDDLSVRKKSGLCAIFTARAGILLRHNFPGRPAALSHSRHGRFQPASANAVRWPACY